MEVVFYVFSGRVGLEDFYEFLICRIVFVFFVGGNDIYVRARIVFFGDGAFRVKACGYDVAAVDDGAVTVFECPRELGCFEFDEVQVFRVFRYVGNDGFDGVRSFFQLDEAVLFEEKKGSAAVGGVIGDSNRSAVGKVIDGFIFVGKKTERCEVGISYGYDVSAVLFVKGVKERTVLEGVEVGVSLGEGLVRRDVVGEGDDGDFESFFFRFFGNKFDDLFRVSRNGAYFDFRFFSGGIFFILPAACDDGGASQCGEGNGNCFFQVHDDFSFLNKMMNLK